jgi:thioredoxin 1
MSIMKPIALTTDEFADVVEQEGIVVIDFWASWCAPCRMFAPTFEGAAMKHDDIVWAKVDTEAEPEIASALGIRAIPTLMIFRGGIVVYSHAGMLSARMLDQVIEQARALDMDRIRKEVEEAELEKEQAAATTASAPSANA